MTSPATTIYDSLTSIVADELHPSGLNALVTGGVWKRRLIRPPSKGATTEAFDAGGRPLISIVVLGREEEADESAPSDPDTGFTGMMAFPQIWFYGQRRDTDRATLETLVQAVYELFQGELRNIAGYGTTSAGIRVIGRNGIDDEPDIENAIFDMLRLQVDGFWAVEE